MFLDFEKRWKNVKKHLIFITQLPAVITGKSPTSNILLRSADRRNYATEMAQKWLRMDHTPEAAGELNYSDHWAISFWRIEEWGLNFC